MIPHAARRDGRRRGRAGGRGDALGLGARLTITFGFGPGMFALAGKDRYGLAKHRPAALVDLPRFNGDQLLPERPAATCSSRRARTTRRSRSTRCASSCASARKRQMRCKAGFVGQAGETPRNLMGFKDGTMNPPMSDPAAMDEFVWAGSEGRHG